eukprot:GEMP01013227.1.p1 GENE.GEMP01013227.1~~GEMP01013227.1.p1  ORF type:complete len:533 (+),score=122.96 GEMP01013227.1:681-2279(+)
MKLFSTDVHFLGHDVWILEPDVLHGDEDVIPVSTAMFCVINLVIQYFAIYTALAVVWTYVQFSHVSPRLLPIKILEAASHTVNCAPMLCVLFVATKMRAAQLTQGEGEPQAWVQILMKVSTWSVLIQCLMVILLPSCIGESASTDDQGNIDQRLARKMPPVAATALMTMRYVAMLGIYGGFVGVIVGVCTMQGSTKSWPEGSPAVSPAVASTINLVIQYFVVYLLLGLMRTWDQLHGRETSKEQRTLKLAQFSVQFAPMLCILFICARMHALQIDPKHEHPQEWAQYCFYMCTYSLLVQTTLVIIAPFLSPKKGDADGSIEFDVHEGTAVVIVTAIRYCVMLTLYSGFTTVIFSVLTFQAGDGKTPVVPTAVRCVIILAIQFCAVYLMLFVAITYRELSGNPIPIIIKTLENARSTVQFCPMLCVLFVGTRMRALQISEQKGNPQVWSQDAMYLSTFALLVQLVVCLLFPFFSGEAARLDHAGNVIFTSQNEAVEAVLTVIRYTALLSLYGGITAVCASLFFMNKATVMGHY